jgi:hypothetical protein
MIATLDTHSTGYVRTVAERSTTILHRALVGTYLHGSAVLGGFAPTHSDLDLLVVTTGPLDAPTKQQLATALAPQALPCPAVRGLELSVVTRTTTLAPTPTPPFELHLATSNATTRVVDGRAAPATPTCCCTSRSAATTAIPSPDPHRGRCSRRSHAAGCCRAWPASWPGPSTTPRSTTACSTPAGRGGSPRRTCWAPSSTADSGHAPASMIPPCGCRKPVHLIRPGHLRGSGRRHDPASRPVRRPLEQVVG